MKLKILQQDLYPALSSVSRSVSTRATLPVLANILLQTENGKLKLAATNLEVGILRSVKAEVEEDGALTIPAKTLVDLVSNLGGEEILLEGSDSQLKISTKNFSSTLNGVPAVEFPSIPVIGKEAAIVDPKVLKDSLPQVIFAAAVEEGRPVLTGVLTAINDKKLELVATDGYRLAHKSIKIESDAKFKALIPKKTFEEVVRLMSEEGLDSVKISTSDDQNQIIFDLGSSVLSSRLIEGSYPLWEKIIPTAIKTRVVMETEELLKAVKLASVFARSEANIIKVETGTSSIKLLSEAKELGRQEKEVEATVEGEVIQIAFNARFLQDILTNIRSTQVVLEFSGNLSATIVKPMGEEGLEHIIMPVNLS